MKDSRDAELEEVRRTYAAYRDGRDRLWDPSNQGYARHARDRDRALVDLMGGAAVGQTTILDLGCGPGDLYGSARSSGLAMSWTGLDLRPEAIEKAERRYPEASWLVASADSMPMPDASFDIVVTSLLFSSIASPEMERATAGEIRRVVRPGGWLIWYDLRYPNPSNRAVHGLGRRQIQALFPGWKAELRSMTVLPPIARRLGVTTPVLYPLLEAIPVLRSHLVGRLQRPAD
jgi:ubiquinone/menaquinone biosynthesis C-methylase UbiE